MNGHSHDILSDLAQRPVTSEAVLKLEALLAAAKRGELQSFAIAYSAGPRTIQTDCCTDLPMELFIGVEMLKATLFGLMTRKGPAPSPLLMPRR